MDGIFISYRRDDSAGYAGRLYDRLVPRFGAARVFMDVEGIEPGADFVTAIEEAVGSCRVLVVIIGDEWLSTQDAAGRRRLDDPHDFIRLETVTALTRGIRVVPVLVGGALMPRAEDLPEDLKPLARRQAIEISHKQWEATTDELIQALEGMLGPDEASTRAPRPVAAPVIQPPEKEKGPGKLIAVGAAVVALIVGGGLWSLKGPPEEDGPTSQGKETGSLLTAEAPTATGRTAGSTAAVVTAAAPPPATPSVGGAAVGGALQAPPTAVVAAAPPVRDATPAAAVARPTAAAAAARAPITPTPRVVQPDAPTPVARAAPEAPRPVSTGLPRVGESWTYRTSGKWPASPSRDIVIAVQAVSNGVVTDSLRGDGLAADVKRSAGAQPAFMNWDSIGNEFSPYLAAYSDVGNLGTLRGFSTPDMPPSWSQWHSEARVLGQETITVPAGSFQAHKVEVWSNRRATGGPTLASVEPVRVQYLVWYAASAKRYVKMQRRVISASGRENERDVFELVAHR